MRRAFDTIYALASQRHRNVFAHFTFEQFRAIRDHALYRLGIMALVDSNELDRITGGSFDEVRFEYHHALGTLVEHFDFDVGCMSEACNEKACGEC